MLEILDPEQNSEFRDNHLNLPFDLSKVFFIATANTLETVPWSLLDRMEVLRLSGYSAEEKLAIAKRYLVPRHSRELALSEEDCRFSDACLKEIISRYTREAGVRQLERAIGRVLRKIGVRIAEGQRQPTTVGPGDLTDLLGPEPFHPEEARKERVPGVAAGLAWTETGGPVIWVRSCRSRRRPLRAISGLMRGSLDSRTECISMCRQAPFRRTVLPRESLSPPPWLRCISSNRPDLTQP
jgi:ATP-dependent Lon protease